MKEMTKIVYAVVMALAGELSALSAVHVETRTMPLIATGVESVGSADGSAVSEWDTTQEPDGWTTLTSGETTADVLVLNESATVVGGRLSSNELWDDTRPIVVRDDVIVPSGITLTLGPGSIVKFTEGAKIVVEDGGAVVAEGTFLTDFSDDSLGGDTNFDGESAASGDCWWLEDEAIAALASVNFINGAMTLPTRTYTAGRSYGELPAPTNEGAKFGGWWTGRNGSGVQVTDESIVASGNTTLYAYWIAWSLTVEPQSADVVATANSGVFAVVANDDWNVSCSADWIALGIDGNEVSYAVDENANTAERTATISVQAANGMKRDFTINQSGMAQLGSVTINPADGTTFIGSSRRISISGAESGAEIRYTLDGSEPTVTSKLYTKSFNVFDTTVVKAKAFKNGSLPSKTVSSRIVRLQTLAEALDVPLWTVATDGDAQWFVEESAGRNGGSCARSGAIGDEQFSTINTTVNGAGTLTFWWKVDCEDDPDYDNWDYLVFEVDGAEVARIDGLTSWQQISFTVKSDTTHTLSWTFCKDYMDDDMTGIEDCGWVDQVSWTPLVSNGTVPLEWIESLGMTSDKVSAAEVANLDPDGDGFTTAQEYIAGTDPTDPDSKLTAHIEIIDGKPVVTYAPDLLSERKYIKLGKVNLSDPNEDWVEVKDGEEENYNFFKVTVDLP